MDDNVKTMISAMDAEHRDRLLRHLLHDKNEADLKTMLAELDGPAMFREYLSRDEAMMIADTFANFDGTTGPKWADPETLFRRAREGGVQCEEEGRYNRWAFYAAANMIYSDYGGVLKQVTDGDRLTRLCLQMARAWMTGNNKGERTIREYLQI